MAHFLLVPLAVATIAYLIGTFKSYGWRDPDWREGLLWAIGAFFLIGLPLDGLMFLHGAGHP